MIQKTGKILEFLRFRWEKLKFSRSAWTELVVAFKTEQGAWRDDSVAQSSCCSCRRSLVPSTHVRWLIITVTLSPGDPSPSL